MIKRNLGNIKVPCLILSTDLLLKRKKMHVYFVNSGWFATSELFEM